MAAFLIWQSVNRNDPLIPLVIFRDRDFSLSNLGVATIGFVGDGDVLAVDVLRAGGVLDFRRRGRRC